MSRDSYLASQVSSIPPGHIQGAMSKQRLNLKLPSTVHQRLISEGMPEGIKGGGQKGLKALQ